MLNRAAVRFGGSDIVFALDMSYLGQTHTVDVTLPAHDKPGAHAVTRAQITEAFEARYKEVYGRPLEGIRVRVLNLRVSVIGRRPKFDLKLLAPDSETSGDEALIGSRRVWVDGAWRDAAIYERLRIPVGKVVPGPAILEQPDTTIFIEPDLEGRTDEFGNLVIARKGG